MSDSKKLLPGERFIAGARCPSCKTLDRIVIDREHANQRCLACGFAATQSRVSVQPIDTRVTRGLSRRVQTRAEPVVLVDPKP